jgi:imidazole glycerol-phosphate synthase subunit HisH
MSTVNEAMAPGIVDTGIGNFGSIINAFRRVGGAPFIVRSVPEVEQASHLVLPGVGSFDAAIRTLDSGGLRAALSRRVLDDGVPVLGICLGMQIFGGSSDEGSLVGLGWLPGRTMRFRPPSGMSEIRVPHIGWNRLATRREGRLLAGLSEEARFYYAHSYHYADGPDEDTVATAEYGYPFAAVVRRRNIVGTQFHPERSGIDGLTLLSNFLAMRRGD